MAAGLLRILSCMLLFGMGAEALHGLGEGAAVIVSGIVAIGINRVWKAQQHADARQQHREDVIADEQLRLEVRHRRRDEGRQP
jgi:hypothetical protein